MPEGVSWEDLKGGTCSMVGVSPGALTVAQNPEFRLAQLSLGRADVLGGEEFPCLEELGWDRNPTTRRCYREEPSTGGGVDPSLKSLRFFPSAHYHLTSC